MINETIEIYNQIPSFYYFECHCFSSSYFYLLLFLSMIYCIGIGHFSRLEIKVKIFKSTMYFSKVDLSPTAYRIIILKKEQHLLFTTIIYCRQTVSSAKEKKRKGRKDGEEKIVKLHSRFHRFG
jgi:hypothetical protein